MTFKNILLSVLLFGVPYGLIMTMLDYREKGFDFWHFVVMSALFGTMMTIYSLYQSRAIFKERGVEDLSRKEIKDLFNNSFVDNMSTEKIIDSLESSPMRYQIKISNNENSISLTHPNSYSTWLGSPIFIESINNSGRFQIKTKGKTQIHATHYLKNALNIKAIKELLSSS